MITSMMIFIKGLLLGVSVSAPPGPNAMLMINRTIRKGRYSGFLTGIGMATADVLFAIIAGLGLSFIVSFINAETFYIKLIAGVVVAAIGIKLFISNPVADIRHRMRGTTDNTPVQDFFSVFAMALTNPFSIFVFLTLFPGMNISFTGSGFLVPLVIILGIFTGASAWWFLVTMMVGRFSRSLRLRNLVKLTRITGVVIIFIGLMVLLTLFLSHHNINLTALWP
jgi:threonine/homoserine/homoserine lactone efflux protein